MLDSATNDVTTANTGFPDTLIDGASGTEDATAVTSPDALAEPISKLRPGDVRKSSFLVGVSVIMCALFHNSKFILSPRFCSTSDLPL